MSAAQAVEAPIVDDDRRVTLARLCENQNCRTLFTPRRADQRFCTGGCRAEASRLRHGEALPTNTFWSGYIQVTRPPRSAQIRTEMGV